jgi:hypothetical protein
LAIDIGETNMTIRPQVRYAALVGALTVAVSAWATHDALNATYIPAPYAVAPAEEVVVVTDTLSPNEVVVTTDAGIGASDSVVVPVVTAPMVVERSVVIEERRLSEDERIQAVVMDRIANNPRISGKIGVESNDSVVKLTGYTRTSGQAWHAERDARSVVGVRYVQNEIRPRVGGSV